MTNDTADLDRATAAARAGNPLRLLEIARSVTTPNARLSYFEVLALAQLGDTDDALRRYAELNLAALADDEDAQSLLGRLMKDKARAATSEARLHFLTEASIAYRAAYGSSKGYFPAINAATTAFVAGDTAFAKSLAADLLARQDLEKPGTYFAGATRAEALLLLGRTEDAEQALRAAGDLGGADLGSRASTVRQMRWLGTALGLSGSAIDRLISAIRPAPIVTYCGYRFNDRGRGEADLMAAVQATLGAQSLGVAYGGLACGADILIAEAVLARGGELNVILPFDRTDYIDICVRAGGERWLGRFEACLDRASSITYASRMNCVADDNQYVYASRLAMGMARLRADQLATEAVQIAVWNGEASESGTNAGTATDVELWRTLQGKTIAIPSGDIDRTLAPAREVAKSPIARATRAILFADFAGFSKLSEAALPRFVSHVLAVIGETLDRHGGHVLDRNSWGDGVVAVVDQPAVAAEIAIAIQSRLSSLALTEAGLPAGGGMRISLHYGPIYEDFDPVRTYNTFYGTEITLAARIEPRVPVGSIYVTQPFAAILMSEPDNHVRFGYVGSIDLAKDYGAREIYRLRFGA